MSDVPMSWARVVGAAGVGYLLGTMPSADVASRLASGGAVDLRSDGSGNPGALNTAHLLGKRWGAAVMAVDIAKGSVAGTAGRAIAGDSGGYAAATAAVAGHIWPLWSNGKGGKGVATSAGACLAVFPAYFPADIAVAAATASTTKNAERSMQFACLAWCAGAVLWWRKRWSNGWGPEPNGGLPLFAAASSAMILTKFRLAARARPPR